MLDRTQLKSALLPKIRQVCMTTTLLSVRVNSLICVGKLLDYMDKWQVIDDVLSWMSAIPSKEPAVIMAIVGIYKLAVSSSKLGLTKEEMANKALPFLIPLSIENGLTVQQFNIIVTLVKEMMTKIETEHRTKLEQLHSMQDSQKSSLQVSLSENMTLPAGQLVSAPTPQEVSTDYLSPHLLTFCLKASSMDNMFSGMGLGDYVNKDKSKLVNSMIDGREKSNPPSESKVSIPSISKSSSMSLQEKRQIMQQQEAAKSQAKPPAQPNLTDTMIAKSVSMNQMPSSSSWSLPPPSTGTGWSQLSSQQPQSLQAKGFGNFSPASSSVRPAAQKPDLSAFDNLLSPTSGVGFQNKQPINSFGGTLRLSYTVSINIFVLTGTNTLRPLSPLQQQGSNNNNSNTKQLSLNDINDLLS